MAENLSIIITLEHFVDEAEEEGVVEAEGVVEV